ncbi:MAG: protein kinase [Chloroflexi bacterium]|nr:protein kinase [Chloroflexota bacterium]
MPSERVQRRIDSLLDQAEQASDDHNWDLVLDLTAGVLKVDPENADAQAFADMAEASMRRSGSIPEEVPLDTPTSTVEDAPSSFANGRYEVKSLLGEGGKKKVYLAHDTTLDRDVAFGLIKAEGLDAGSRQRIIREAQAMARLGDHPNLMPIFDLGDENGQPFMVQPLMVGGDVEALIEAAEGGRLSLEDALRITTEILRGLDFAHAKGIIHRDLKPGNVWLTDDGTVRIGDFGLALSLDRSRLTQEKMMVGTVSYMPPEQATGGEITAQADLYSLGAMLYEMVAGRAPFLGDDEVAIISQHVNTPPVAPAWHNPGIPAVLDSLIMRLLSKSPGERPESASDVLAAIGAIDLTTAPPPQPSPNGRGVPGEAEQATGGSLEGMAGGVFVGRQREMDQLKATLENALAGHGAMVALVGEPGIGKTRTSLELETYAGLRNAQVLWGRCYEGGGAPPYWPWVQAIRSYIAGREPDDLRREMGSTASVISEIVDDVKERLPDVQAPVRLEDPESARFRLFDSITTFLRNAGQVRPIILILDDLHWADKPSLLLLEFVVRELASSRILVLGTYRDMELNRRHPLSMTLGDLTRERLFERVILRGLTREDIARFIEIAAGIVPPRGLVDAVHTQTEGNPLFVTETVRLLIQEGDLHSESLGERDSWTVRIPEGVREVIGRRLDRLSERCNEMLTVASIVGRRFSLDQMKVLMEDLTEDRLLDTLDEGLAARVIDELPDRVGWYEFAHAMFQETLAEELSATRTVRMHARIAEALESLYGDEAHAHADELVAHFAEAETVLGTEKLVEYSQSAGDQALNAYAYEDAHAILSRALEAISDDETDSAKAALLFSFFKAAHNLGDPMEIQWEALVEAFNFYDASGDVERALEVADLIPPPSNRLTGHSRVTGRAVDLAPTDTVAEARAQIRHGWIVAISDGDLETATPHIERAEELARSLADTESATLIHRLQVAINGNYLKWEDCAKAGREYLREIEQNAPKTWAGGLMIFACRGMTTLGDSKTSETLAMLEVTTAERTNDRIGIVAGFSSLFSASLVTGDWTKAKDMLDRTAAIRDASFTAHRYLILEAQTTGNSERIDEFVSHIGLGDYSAVGGLLNQGAIYVGLWAVAGRILDDQELLDHAGEFSRKALDVQPPLPPLARQQHQVSVSLDMILNRDASHAKELYEELMPSSGTMVISDSLSGDHLLGLLADLSGESNVAVEHFEAAMVFCRDAGYRPELAWTMADYAEMLNTRNEAGDSERAGELQDEAIGIAQELGMKPLLERLLGQREILKS